MCNLILKKLAQRERRNKERLVKGLPIKEYPPILVEAFVEKIRIQSEDWMNIYSNGYYKILIAGHYYRVTCRFTRKAVSFVCPLSDKYCTLTIFAFEMYKPILIEKDETCNPLVSKYA